MASRIETVEYVCDQLRDVGIIRYRKMFGEYMVYVNEKPIVLICDDTVYVKKLDIIEKDMKNAECGYPYEGAKEHYILDIDDTEFARAIISKIESVTPLPKKRTKKQ